MSSIRGTRLTVWSLGKPNEWVLAYHPYRTEVVKNREVEIPMAGRLGDSHTHFADPKVYPTEVEAFAAKIEKLKSGELREYKR